MHDLEPFYRWDGYYNAARDERSPFAGVQPNYQAYENDIYGFYIHPDWDFIGSETLYCKLLFADYDAGFAVLEMMGEWNDTLHNDIMHLKRNVIDLMIPETLKRQRPLVKRKFRKARKKTEIKKTSDNTAIKNTNNKVY